MPLGLDDYLEAAMWLSRRCEDGAEEDFVCVYSKHQVSDLTPGLSDWDTRLVMRNGTSHERWREVYPASVDAYLEMLQERPQWARILEHPPGYVFTPAEIRAFLLHHHEALCWEMLWGFEPPERLKPLPASTRRAHQLSLLAAFIGFFRPDDPSTDPPINLDPELLLRYPLYSSISHYFLPMLRAAIGLLSEEAGFSKKQGLATALEYLPDDPVLEDIQTVIEKQYDIPEFCNPAKLQALREGMFDLACRLFADIRSQCADMMETAPPPAQASPLCSLPSIDIRSLVSEDRLSIFESIVLSPGVMGKGRQIIAAIGEQEAPCANREELAALLQPVAQAMGARLAPLLTSEEMAYAYPLIRPFERVAMASGVLLWGKPLEEWLPWPSQEIFKETALRAMSLSTSSARVRPPLLDYMQKTPEWFEVEWLLGTQVYSHMHASGLINWLTAQSVLHSEKVPLSVEEAFDAIPSLKESEEKRKVFLDLLDRTAPGQPIDPPALQAMIPPWQRLEEIIGEWWQECFG